MINRQNKTYEVFVRQDGLDDYGQRKSIQATSNKSVEIAITMYQQKENYTNPMYKEVTHFGLTNDKTLVEGMIVKNSNKSYNIILVNNETKKTQLFLTEVV